MLSTFLLVIFSQAAAKDAPKFAPGETVFVVNDHGAETVAILSGGKFVHLKNPARVRITDGQLKMRSNGLVLGYEVEVVEGESKGVKGVANPNAIRKPPKSEARKPAAPADPAARLKSLFAMATNLDKQGNVAGAIKFYGEVVRLYPESDQARKAKARIGEIERSAKAQAGR